MKTHYFWPVRRFDELRREEIDARAWTQTACNGNCDQGDKCNCGPKEAASSCTEIGADGVPSVWESADGEVIPAFIGAFIALLAFCALIGMLQP